MKGYKTVLWGLRRPCHAQDRERADWVQMVISPDPVAQILMEGARNGAGDTYTLEQMYIQANHLKADGVILPTDALSPRMLVWMFMMTEKFHSGERPNKVAVYVMCGMDNCLEQIGYL